MQLNLSHITFTYPGTFDPVLSDVSLTFPQGWTGIVGANGSGKSTLAKLATRALFPDEGFVSPTLMSAFCEQETEHPPKQGLDFVSDYSKDAIRTKATLGIEDDWIWRYETLSHGERKRLQIGTALWAQADVLVVDEPTNHLDAATQEAVLSALQTFRGVGLVISHDRDLLDNLVDQCVFVDKKQAQMRPGTYSQGHEQEQRERLTQEREHRDARRDLARLNREKVQRAQKADQAADRRSKRGISAKDHSAKAKIDLAIFTGQDGKRGKLSTQLNARVDRAAERAETSTTDKRYEGNIWMVAHPSPRKTLVRQEETDISLGNERVLSVPNLTVGNTDHIGIVGVNGAGKSTLINHLVAQLDDDLKVVYLPQELSAEESRRVVSSVNKLAAREKGLLFSVVAQLNSDPDMIMQGESVSPGEVRKLMLAVGLLDDPDLIIMDEPTNHLDLLSIEAMERVLGDCPCAVLLVSHDKAFVEATTDIRWSLEQDEEENSSLTVIL